MARPAASPAPERLIAGRFEMFGSLASGGFAAVHLGRTRGGAGGFSKLVAIKRLHRQYVEDEDVVRMFLDEARVVARVRHPNVIPIFDFVEEDGELFLVMEYVEGATLHHVLHDLTKKDRLIPVDVTMQIMTGVLRGLHAAHEARDESGHALCVIHRDVAPDNIIVGVDGYARILDFGVARAMGRYHATRDGQIKGKLSYMTPEQVMGTPLTRRTDVFAASVVLWQCLTGQKLFEAEHLGELAHKVTQQTIQAPSVFNRMLPPGYDEIVLRGLERDADKRWLTAEEMAEAIVAAGPVASPGRTGRWLKGAAKERLADRSERVAAMAVVTPIGSSAPPVEDAAEASEGERSYKATVTQVLQVTERHDSHMDEQKVAIRPRTSRRQLGRSDPPSSAVHASGPASSPAPPPSGPGMPAAPPIPRPAAQPQVPPVVAAAPAAAAPMPVAPTPEPLTDAMRIIDPVSSDPDTEVMPAPAVSRPGGYDVPLDPLTEPERPPSRAGVAAVALLCGAVIAAGVWVLAARNGDVVEAPAAARPSVAPSPSPPAPPPPAPETAAPAEEAAVAEAEPAAAEAAEPEPSATTAVARDGPRPAPPTYRKPSGPPPKKPPPKGKSEDSLFGRK
jgi:eukaryotic-like serine/threonine-protein kinase